MCVHAERRVAGNLDLNLGFWLLLVCQTGLLYVSRKWVPSLTSISGLSGCDGHLFCAGRSDYRRAERAGEKIENVTCHIATFASDF